MCKAELIEFYTNAKGTATSIASTVRGAPIEITQVIAQVLGVPNAVLDFYVRNKWPTLDGLPSALDIPSPQAPESGEKGNVEIA